MKINFDYLFFSSIALLLFLNEPVTVFLGVIFACLHELGHIFALFICKVKVKSINFFAFDITISAQDNNFCSYKNECLYYFCGPFVNFFFAVVFYKVNYTAFLCNSALFLLNILPFGYLDGNMLLKNTLLCFFSLEKALNIHRILNIVFFCIVTVLFVLMILFFSVNWNLITIYLLIIVNFFTLKH